ncbi:MAG: hypothetical protein HGA31_03600 [Candidatus Moranbacteria bacterium]|nr:hypothetical protein [Candidatus Moranbacteria bacterium]
MILQCVIIFAFGYLAFSMFTDTTKMMYERVIWSAFTAILGTCVAILVSAVLADVFPFEKCNIRHEGKLPISNINKIISYDVGKYQVRRSVRYSFEYLGSNLKKRSNSVAVNTTRVIRDVTEGDVHYLEIMTLEFVHPSWVQWSFVPSYINDMERNRRRYLIHISSGTIIETIDRGLDESQISDE